MVLTVIASRIVSYRIVWWENGATTEEANKSRLVVYKQMEQKFIATNKKNSIINKFHKKCYNIYNNNLLLQTCATTFVMGLFSLLLVSRLGLFSHQQLIFNMTAYQGPDLQNILRQSYDNAKITINLRQNSYEGRRFCLIGMIHLQSCKIV